MHAPGQRRVLDDGDEGEARPHVVAHAVGALPHTVLADLQHVARHLHAAGVGVGWGGGLLKWVRDSDLAGLCYLGVRVEAIPLSGQHMYSRH